MLVNDQDVDVNARSTMRHDVPDRAADQLGGDCAAPPSPEFLERWRRQLDDARATLPEEGAPDLRIEGEPTSLGLNDGVIIPPETFPVGTPLSRIRNAAADRAPLRGTVRIIVVPVDFSDRQMGQNTAHFEELFFSTGALPHGSVKEHYTEVTAGLMNLDGTVVGTYRMPQTLAWDANDNFGLGKPGRVDFLTAQMARAAAVAADPDVDFSQYDNDGNGFVDAFVVVHAGPDAAMTGRVTRDSTEGTIR